MRTYIYKYANYKYCWLKCTRTGNKLNIYYTRMNMHVCRIVNIYTTQKLCTYIYAVCTHSSPLKERILSLLYVYIHFMKLKLKFAMIVLGYIHRLTRHIAVWGVVWEPKVYHRNFDAEYKIPYVCVYKMFALILYYRLNRPVT